MIAALLAILDLDLLFYPITESERFRNTLLEALKFLPEIVIMEHFCVSNQPRKETKREFGSVINEFPIEFRPLIRSVII